MGGLCFAYNRCTCMSVWTKNKNKPKQLNQTLHEQKSPQLESCENLLPSFTKAGFVHLFTWNSLSYSTSFDWPPESWAEPHTAFLSRPLSFEDDGNGLWATYYTRYLQKACQGWNRYPLLNFKNIQYINRKRQKRLTRMNANTSGILWVCITPG